MTRAGTPSAQKPQDVVAMKPAYLRLCGLQALAGRGDYVGADYGAGGHAGSPSAFMLGPRRSFPTSRSRTTRRRIGARRRSEPQWFPRSEPSGRRPDNTTKPSIAIAESFHRLTSQGFMQFRIGTIGIVGKSRRGGQRARIPI